MFNNEYSYSINEIEKLRRKAKHDKAMMERDLRFVLILQKLTKQYKQYLINHPNIGYRAKEQISKLDPDDFVQFYINSYGYIVHDRDGESTIFIQKKLAKELFFNFYDPDLFLFEALRELVHRGYLQAGIVALMYSLVFLRPAILHDYGSTNYGYHIEKARAYLNLLKNKNKIIKKHDKKTRKIIEGLFFSATVLYSISTYRTILITNELTGKPKKISLSDNSHRNILIALSKGREEKLKDQLIDRAAELFAIMEQTWIDNLGKIKFDEEIFYFQISNVQVSYMQLQEFLAKKGIILKKSVARNLLIGNIINRASDEYLIIDPI